MAKKDAAKSKVVKTKSDATASEEKENSKAQNSKINSENEIPKSTEVKQVKNSTKANNQQQNVSSNSTLFLQIFLISSLTHIFSLFLYNSEFLAEKTEWESFQASFKNNLNSELKVLKSHQEKLDHKITRSNENTEKTIKNFNNALSNQEHKFIDYEKSLNQINEIFSDSQAEKEKDNKKRFSQQEIDINALYEKMANLESRFNNLFETSKDLDRKLSKNIEILEKTTQNSLNKFDTKLEDFIKTSNQKMNQMQPDKVEAFMADLKKQQNGIILLADDLKNSLADSENKISESMSSSEAVVKEQAQNNEIMRIAEEQLLLVGFFDILMLKFFVQKANLD